ncbi:tyrosine-type recombinase/integrase [Rummeliibacillus pycnus]|uniref:tyrosine-type recombinase/integrase n=1 Tax=Rummeliibacillus pycnus TaxID=101070 RepID=UPI0037C65656
MSYLVPLMIQDVRGKTHLVITEQKTKKTKLFLIPRATRELIKDYTRDMSSSTCLFPNQKGNSHISIHQTGLQSAAEALCRDDIGTHTMRKTFGYHLYKQNKDVAVLQQLFNRSAPSITMKYIGMSEDEVNATMEYFAL